MQFCRTSWDSAGKGNPDPSEYFLVEAGHGDSRLEITLGEREVLVSIDGAKPEKYKVVANTIGVLTAILVGEIEPSFSSISIDKVTSYVIWSTTEPRDFTRDVPRYTATLFACSPASKR
jgi:Gpi18-like mannosyltransferase